MATPQVMNGYPYDAANVMDVYCNDTGAQSVLFAAISISSSTSSTSIVAAVTGKKIRVLAWKGVLTGTNPTLTWQTQTGPTALTGAMNPASGTLLSGGYQDSIWGQLETNSGDGLFLQLGGTTPSFFGYLVYVAH